MNRQDLIQGLDKVRQHLEDKQYYLATQKLQSLLNANRGSHANRIRAIHHLGLDDPSVNIKAIDAFIIDLEK